MVLPNLAAVLLLSKVVVEETDLRGTLEIARRFHPKVRTVIASVNSNATGIANRNMLERSMPAFKGSLGIEIVQDPELAPFLKRLKALPKDECLILLTGIGVSLFGKPRCGK